MMMENQSGAENDSRIIIYDLAERLDFRLTSHHARLDIATPTPNILQRAPRVPVANFAMLKERA